MHPIVTVDKGDPFAGTISKRPVDARVAGVGEPAVLLVDDGNADVFCRIFVAYRAAVVRRPVVDEDEEWRKPRRLRRR